MRSLLFVPGDQPAKIARALASGADALILDLEDSVAPERRAEARAVVTDALRRGAGTDGPRLLVRVNPLGTADLDRDLDAVVPAAPAALVLPKSTRGADVTHLGAKLAVREAEGDLPEGSVGVLAIATETAGSLFGLGTYGGASRRLIGMAWGAEDLSASLGAETNRQADGRLAEPYRLARALTLAGAAAAGVAPVDAVFTAYRDLDGLAAEAEAARRDGFTAKMAIHPAQVAAINRVFTPTEAAVARARAVVAAFAAAPGAGVVGLGGEMLDRPHLARAERVLERGAQAGVA